VTRSPSADVALPLAGVKVVDLTFNISGPYATMILGDLGADVVKIERPGGGDDARRMTPVYGDGSAYFFAINRNKRSVALDVRSEDDREVLFGMLADADVFTTNLRPHKLDELGLDYDALHGRFPELVYADISGYGVGGPEENRAGYDMVLQARSGLMSVTGEPGRPPVRVGVSILDMGAGMWLALGVLAGLRARDLTGEGQRVATSLLEAGVGFMAYDIAVHELTGLVAGPRGSGHPAFGPYGSFGAKDGYLAIGVGADHVFARLAKALGRPEWSEDPLYARNEDRVAHREELTAEIEARLAESTVAEWIGVLSDAGVPAEPVADVSSLPPDPQLDAIGCWLEVRVDGPNGDRRTLRLPGLPIRFSGVRPPVQGHPPALPEEGGRNT
jgi:CoA:oxalate CoA-transferase